MYPYSCKKECFAVRWVGGGGGEKQLNVFVGLKFNESYNQRGVNQ